MHKERDRKPLPVIRALNEPYQTGFFWQLFARNTFAFWSTRAFFRDSSLSLENDKAFSRLDLSPPLSVHTPTLHAEALHPRIHGQREFRPHCCGRRPSSTEPTVQRLVPRNSPLASSPIPCRDMRPPLEAPYFLQSPHREGRLNNYAEKHPYGRIHVSLGGHFRPQRPRFRVILHSERRGKYKRTGSHYFPAILTALSLFF